jgi:hypothetical protein
MKRKVFALMVVAILAVSLGAFAQSVEIVSVYPKTQFSSQSLSTSNFTVVFNTEQIQGNYYLKLFLTNVSSSAKITVNWQGASLLISGQTVMPDFKELPPSTISVGSYVEAYIKLSGNIQLSKTSIISLNLPVSVSNSTTTYEIRLQIQPLSLSPSSSQPPAVKSQFPFKHLWDFPLQWGTVNFNEKGQAVSTTTGAFGVPFLFCAQKNFFSPLHVGINTYWGYDTIFAIIPVSVNIGADYIANGGFYVGIGLGASWIYFLTPSSNYDDENYAPPSPVYPTLTIGTYY